MPHKPDLAALVGSRICHDLISPIGAIGNGVELVLLDAAVGGPEVTLIADSVSHANARIRFFRIAFGATGADQPDQPRRSRGDPDRYDRRQPACNRTGTAPPTCRAAT